MIVHRLKIYTTNLSIILSELILIIIQEILQLLKKEDFINTYMKNLQNNKKS